jgi:hypothetical protein
VGIKAVSYPNVQWVHLTQDRVQWKHSVNTVMKFPVPLEAGNCLISSETVTILTKDCASWSYFVQVKQITCSSWTLKYQIRRKKRYGTDLSRIHFQDIIAKGFISQF